MPPLLARRTSCAFCIFAACARATRLTRLDHRTDENHRSADRSHRTPRKCIRRLRCRDSIHAISGRPTTTGWDPAHIARAWTVLMKRLGYKKFVAQGGDWGAIITELMGVQAPPELMGIHTNMANVIPLDIDKLAFSGAPAPANLSADEKLAYERLSFVYAKGIGYGFQMGLRPQTLYGCRQNLPREPPPLQIVAARAHRAPASTPRIAAESPIRRSSPSATRAESHWESPPRSSIQKFLYGPLGDKL